MNRAQHTKKKNLLLVYNFNRQDFLSYFHACKSHFNFFFAEFTSPQEVTNKQYQEFGKAIYWGDYKDAFDLLEKVKPDKVLFTYIESYFHMALNIACKVKGIPTYLLDHGVQDSNAHQILAAYTSSTPKKPALKRLFTILSQAPARVKARRFLLRTAAALPAPEANAFKKYCQLRKTENYIAILGKLNDAVYRADAYLAISPKVAESHTKLLNYSPRKTYFFGIPTYDRLADLPLAEPQSDILIFIDQGLATAGFLGWTSEAFHRFTQDFASICARHGYEIFVKKHPRQPASDWNNLLDNSNVHIINDQELVTLLPKAAVIAGFFSTYLLPLVAYRHTTLLTLENHPAGKLHISKLFTEAGVAHPVYELNELDWALGHIDDIHGHQLPNKVNFTENWLYKFDGKSGERLRDLLLKDKL